MAAVSQQAKITAISAYLDLAEPDLEAAAGQLAEAGHTNAVVVPLLFTEAFHATVDVPETVGNVTESLPIQLIVADILGTGDDVADAAASRAWSRHASMIIPQCCSLLSGRPGRRPTRPLLILRLGSRPAGVAPVRACFGTCFPGVADVVDELAEPIAVLPLFLTEGLLLAPVRALAAQRGWRIIEPLGERAAGLVRRRYDSALGIQVS